MDSEEIEKSEIVKGKNILLASQSEYKECQRLLYVKIRYAEGIDQKFPNPNCKKEDSRVYRVLGGVGEGLEFFTPSEQGLPDPSWNCWKVFNTLTLDDDMDYKYLFVEVLKLWSRQDPGTSTGYRVVGRAAIPLPKVLNQITNGRYGLVRQNGDGVVGDGHIIVSMQIKMFG